MVTVDYLLEKFENTPNATGEQPPKINRERAECLLRQTHKTAEKLNESERHVLIYIWKAYVLMGEGKVSELVDLAINYQKTKHPFRTKEGKPRTAGGAFLEMTKNYISNSKPQYLKWYRRYWAKKKV